MQSTICRMHFSYFSIVKVLNAHLGEGHYTWNNSCSPLAPYAYSTTGIWKNAWIHWTIWESLRHGTAMQQWLSSLSPVISIKRQFVATWYTICFFTCFFTPSPDRMNYWYKTPFAGLPQWLYTRSVQKETELLKKRANRRTECTAASERIQRQV